MRTKARSGRDGSVAPGGSAPASHTIAVYGALRQRIVDNAVPPGSHLSIKALSDEFNVSRTPIRDALIRLEKEGLIEFVPHQGVRILPLSADDMREIYMILAGLEAVAVDTIITARPTAEDLTVMESAMADMERALEADDLPAWARADEAFHDALVSLADNKRLRGLVMSYRTQTHRARLITLRLRPKPVKSTEYHRAVLAAIREGERDTARSLHFAQRLRSASELTEILAQLNLSHL